MTRPKPYLPCFWLTLAAALGLLLLAVGIVPALKILGQRFSATYKTYSEADMPTSEPSIQELNLTSLPLNPLWTRETPMPIDRTPWIVDNVVLLEGDQTLVGLDPTSGSIIWSFQAPGSIDDYTSRSVVVEGHHVAFRVLPGGTLYLLDISTGTPYLTAPLGQLVTRTVTLTNSGQVTDTYMLTIRGSNAQFQASLFAEGYDSPRSLVLGPQAAVDLTIWERLPLNSTLGVSNTFTVQAVGGYGVADEVELTISLPSFQEVGGQLVLEAEHFIGRTTHSGHTWITQTVLSGYVGPGYLSALPDTDVQFTAGYTTSPEVQYTINVTTTGTYYIWLRGYAPNGAGDSVHIGLDGQPGATLTGFGPRAWSWANSNSQGGLATLEITTPGVHRLHLWQREDGLRLDRIVLTSNSGYNPTGDGPPESELE